MRYMFVLLVAGCATQSSGVARWSTDGVMSISGKNMGIGATASDVMADLHKRATAHCARARREVEVLRAESHGPGLARFPEGRLEFRCVER